jgi:hypothetical protein
MSDDVAPKVTWAQETALTLVREAIADGGGIDPARVFKLGAEPGDGHAVTNIVQVTATLVTHLSTLLTFAAGSPEGAQALVDQMLDTNHKMRNDLT